MNASSVLKGLPPPEAWKSILLARGPAIATAVLAIVAAVQLAVILTDLASAPVVISEETVAPPRVASRLDVAALVNAHLFGEAAVVRGDPGAAPQTSMPLVLAGIIANTDPEKGIALIGNNAASAKVVLVGQAVPSGGATLHAVYRDRVVLDRNGTLESLALPRQTPRAAPPPASLPPVAAAGGANPILDRMRSMVESDPGVIGEVMRPQPVFAQGKQRGYRVYPGPNRAAFSKLGLRPGDLVTEINGTPLDDPTRGNEVLNTLGSASEARVTVMRNGRQQELTLDLAQVANEAATLGGESPPADGADSSTPEEAAAALSSPADESNDNAP